MGSRKDYIPIAADIVQKAIAHVCQYDNLNIALQLENEIHAFRFPLAPKIYQSWGISAHDALNLTQAKDLHVVKMVIFYSGLIDSTTIVDAKLVEDLEKLCCGSAQFYLTDNGKCVQIMARAVNKLSSIEKIRNMLGLEKNEIAVFGDEVNDIEMISAYENSVAMGNASDDVKSKARYVTLGNDHDGIHHAICNIFHLMPIPI